MITTPKKLARSRRVILAAALVGGIVWGNDARIEYYEVGTGVALTKIMAPTERPVPDIKVVNATIDESPEQVANLARVAEKAADVLADGKFYRNLLTEFGISIVDGTVPEDAYDADIPFVASVFGGSAHAPCADLDRSERLVRKTTPGLGDPVEECEAVKGVEADLLTDQLRREMMVAALSWCKPTQVFVDDLTPAEEAGARKEIENRPWTKRQPAEAAEYVANVKVEHPALTELHTTAVADLTDIFTKLRGKLDTPTCHATFKNLAKPIRPRPNSEVEGKGA